MRNLTVEETRQLLNRYNIAFTDGAVTSLVQRQVLRTVPKPYSNVRGDTKFNFMVLAESVEMFLRRLGIPEEEIIEALN